MNAKVRDNIQEIKETLWPRNEKEVQKKSENSIRGVRRGERVECSDDSEEEEEEVQRHWMKRVKLPTVRM